MKRQPNCAQSIRHHAELLTYDTDGFNVGLIIPDVRVFNPIYHACILSEEFAKPYKVSRTAGVEAKRWQCRVSGVAESDKPWLKLGT
jgi:hypothetical protein